MDRAETDTAWAALLAARDGAAPAAGPLAPLFAPILAPPSAPDGCRVVGRLAQTLDGRIATASGQQPMDRRAGRHPAHPSPARALPRRHRGRRHGAPRRPAPDDARGAGPRPGARGDRHGSRRLGPIIGSSAKARRLCSPAPTTRRAATGTARPRCCACRAKPRAASIGRAARRAGRARPDPHLRRGRRPHRLPLPRRRLPRPAARDGRAGAARLRHPGLHPAGGAAHRGRAALLLDACTRSGEDILLDIPLDRARRGDGEEKARGRA
jgi:hypothetical protein